MQKRDPRYQLEIENMRGQMEDRRLDNRREDARFGLDERKFKTDAELAREKFEWEKNKPTADIQEYEFYEKRAREAGEEPLGPLEWDIARRQAGAANMTQTVGEGDKFFDELDKSQAQMFSTLQQGGLEAGQTLVRLDRLEELLANVPTGATANFKQIAGNYGINTEGLDDIQAATALINQMVPEQRPAGSGPMSDADLELFKQSVPRIINQPGGNQRIIETMRGIATYTQQQGDIANRVANRELSPTEGRQMLSQLQNPLEGFGQKEQSGLPEGVTEDDIEFTMQKHGLTREQVLERLNAP